MTSYFWTSGFKQEREFSHSATKKKKGVHVQQKISKATEEDYHASMSTDQRAGTNELAYTSIILHLFDKVLRKVGKLDNAKALWEKLEDLYLVKSLPNKIFL